MPKYFFLLSKTDFEFSREIYGKTPARPVSLDQLKLRAREHSQLISFIFSVCNCKWKLQDCVP